MGEFSHIWATSDKVGQVWMSHTDWAELVDKSSGWVCMCLQAQGWWASLGILAIVGKDVQVLMCQTGQMGMVDVSRG